MVNEPEIGDMDEGVVERGKDAGDAENELTYSGCQRETFFRLLSREMGFEWNRTNLL